MNFTRYKGATLLRDWWGVVKSHFIEVQTAHNALEEAFDEHSKESGEAIQAVQDAILEEAGLRDNGERQLTKDISNEREDRRINDEKIREDIEAEKTARSEGDDELMRVINGLDTGSSFRNEYVLAGIDGIEVEKCRKRCTSIDSELTSIWNVLISAVACIKQLYDINGIAVYDGGYVDDGQDYTFELTGGSIISSTIASVDCGELDASVLDAK